MIRAGNLQPIASTTINSDQHSLEEEELDDVSFDFKPSPPKIWSFSDTSTHWKMSNLFLMLKDTVSKQRWFLLL